MHHNPWSFNARARCKAVHFHPAASKSEVYFFYNALVKKRRISKKRINKIDKQKQNQWNKETESVF